MKPVLISFQEHTRSAVRYGLVTVCLAAGLAACASGQQPVPEPNSAVSSAEIAQPAAMASPTALPPEMPSPTAVPAQPPEPTPSPTRTPRPTRTPTPTARPTAPPAPTLAPIGEIQPIPDGIVTLGDETTGALGLDMRAGGAIGSLRLAGRELVDRADFGRYVQLSLYDGAQTYGAKGNDPYGNWGWNPLQAGSRGDGASAGAKVLEFRSGDDALYVKALAKEWGHFGQDSDVIYETWAWQREGYFEITTRATHVGDDAHSLTTHEFPAAYIGTSLTRMTTYLGDAPFAAAPAAALDHVAKEGEIAGMASCPRVNPTENWAAFGDATGFGLILAVPPQPYLEPRWNICLLYDRPPVGYISPMAAFDVPAGAVREITYYLIPGPIDAGRAIVYDLMPHTTWTFDLGTFEGWQAASPEDGVADGVLTAHVAPGSALLSRPRLIISGAISPAVTVSARAPASGAEICVAFVTTVDPDWDTAKRACAALTPGDFQTLAFDFTANNRWNDAVITQLRLDASQPVVVEIDSMQVEKAGEAWEFESAGDVEGWVAWDHLGPLDATQGSLVAEATGDDPYMGSPGIAVDAQAFPIVEARLAVTAGGAAQLFFTTSSDSAYDETKSLVKPLRADGEFHTYRFDMGSVLAWKDTITQLRLDPTNAQASIQVDYIRILSR